MSNAAVFMHANAFDTTGRRLLGRHSAGESFLRGFLRHADVDQFWFHNGGNTRQADLEALVARIEDVRRPVRWVAGADRAQLAEVGVLYIPSPEIGRESWQRRVHGSRTYAICGITHTTASAGVMRLIPDLLIEPLEEYDALICTSTAVRDSVESQITLMRDYMREEYGPRRRPEPQRATIPLGVNAADFATSPEHRKAWRERLDIPADALVALYVGRFNIRGKMNPALMARALERAAQRLGRPLYWVNSGWAESEEEEANFHDETRKLCPSVAYRSVDGRGADVRFSIWSVADIFISFSDNIQETFGLTPIEAMAAGLPGVVSDWDGYKDTVRHGVDGFRVPTLAPRPGLGGDIAYWYSNNWMNYDNYVGSVGQAVSVDMEEAERAIVTLCENPDLRRRMGEAARMRARELFDWSAIIPQYQALWAEQDARRRAAGPDNTARANPYRPDPYYLFAGYPTRTLRRDDLLTARPGLSPAAAAEILDAPLAAYSRLNRPTPAEVADILETLGAQPGVTVAALLERYPAPRRNYLERGLLWLARHDVIVVSRPD